jgi:hypothetical protein
MKFKSTMSDSFENSYKRMIFLASVIPAKAGIQALSSPRWKTGVHPLPVTWIPFSNGMTDAVRHLDSRVRGNDEPRECQRNRNSLRFHTL